jgi:pimeloyl-ACP methyl ester carboxylesterase
MLVGVLVLVQGVHARTADAATRTLFVVSIASGLADRPVSGRLIVLLAKGVKGESDEQMLEPGFLDPESVYVTGMEVRNVEPGRTFEVRSDQVAFPRSLADAPAGAYRAQAILDVDHSFTYSGSGAGDLTSAIVPIESFDPASTAPTTLTLANRVPDAQPADTPIVKLETFVSPSLSAFWGRPITMRAAVVLPFDYDKAPAKRYPTVYRIHGYSGSHRRAWRQGPTLVADQAKGAIPAMINVFLDGSCPMGHHEFADSANNGPWGHALTKELIPYLEKRYRMDAVPRGRLLTGHSSGGWSTLWLAITYPEVFGGTWSTSPDPVDFRDFTGIDLTRPDSENFYTTADGRERNLVRFQGRDVMSVRQYALLERVEGEYGGQWASFEAVFSPKGDDGRPMHLFDPETGRIDPVVAKAWAKYDIARVLRANWARLGPKLKGRIHIIVGSADTFHLERPVYLLRDVLKELGSDATIEVLDGRDHMDLYEGGLDQRIAKEMYATARPATRR